jgi:hypothetical protein
MLQLNTSIAPLLCISSLLASQSGIVFRVGRLGTDGLARRCFERKFRHDDGWRVTLQRRLGKLPLAIESIDGRNCRLPRGVIREFNVVLEIVSYTGFFVPALQVHDGSVRSPAGPPKVC